MKTYRVLAASIALAIGGAAACAADDLTVTGYLSVGGGVLDESYPLAAAKIGAAGSNEGYTDDRWAFDQDNIIGLQFSKSLSDKLTATAQLVAKGAEDYDMTAEWAYVSFQATDSLKLRAGRFVVPFYLYSDFRNVGYALPWIRAPQSVYSLPFNATNGVDFVWTPSFWEWDLTMQGYFGSNSFKAPALNNADTKTQDGNGLALTLTRDWLTLRVAHHQADVTIDGTDVILDADSGLTLEDFPEFAQQNFNQLQAAALAAAGQFNAAIGAPFLNWQMQLKFDPRLLRVDQDRFTFDEAAIAIDSGRFLFALEKTRLRSDTFFRGNDRDYAMVGVRFGDFLLHGTYGRADDPVQDMVSQAKGVSVPSCFQTSQGCLPLNQVFPAQLIAAMNGAEQQINGNFGKIYGGIQAVADNVQRTYTTTGIGLRWDFTTSAAFKFEVEELDDDKSDKTRLTSFAVQTVF